MLNIFDRVSQCQKVLWQTQVLIKTEIKNCVFHFFFPEFLSNFFFHLSFIFAFYILRKLFSFMFEFFFAAVVSCNLKNITANCQNALTFTNYFAGSSHGVPVVQWCTCRSWGRLTLWNAKWKRSPLICVNGLIKFRVAFLLLILLFGVWFGIWYVGNKVG